MNAPHAARHPSSPPRLLAIILCLLTLSLPVDAACLTAPAHIDNFVKQGYTATQIRDASRNVAADTTSTPADKDTAQRILTALNARLPLFKATDFTTATLDTLTAEAAVRDIDTTTPASLPGETPAITNERQRAQLIPLLVADDFTRSGILPGTPLQVISTSGTVRQLTYKGTDTTGIIVITPDGQTTHYRYDRLAYFKKTNAQTGETPFPSYPDDLVLLAKMGRARGMGSIDVEPTITPGITREDFTAQVKTDILTRDLSDAGVTQGATLSLRLTDGSVVQGTVFDVDLTHGIRIETAQGMRNVAFDNAQSYRIITSAPTQITPIAPAAPAVRQNTVTVDFIDAINKKLGNTLGTITDITRRPEGTLTITFKSDQTTAAVLGPTNQLVLDNGLLLSTVTIGPEGKNFQTPDGTYTIRQIVVNGKDVLSVERRLSLTQRLLQQDTNIARVDLDTLEKSANEETTQRQQNIRNTFNLDPALLEQQSPQTDKIHTKDLGNDRPAALDAQAGQQFIDTLSLSVDTPRAAAFKTTNGEWKLVTDFVADQGPARRSGENPATYLDRALTTAIPDPTSRAAAIDKVLADLVVLNKLGFVDINPSNLLITKNKVHLIDLTLEDPARPTDNGPDYDLIAQNRLGSESFRKELGDAIDNILGRWEQRRTSFEQSLLDAGSSNDEAASRMALFDKKQAALQSLKYDVAAPTAQPTPQPARPTTPSTTPTTERVSTAQFTRPSETDYPDVAANVGALQAGIDAAWRGIIEQQKRVSGPLSFYASIDAQGRIVDVTTLPPSHGTPYAALTIDPFSRRINNIDINYETLPSDVRGTIQQALKETGGEYMAAVNAKTTVIEPFQQSLAAALIGTPHEGSTVDIRLARRDLGTSLSRNAYIGINQLDSSGNVVDRFEIPLPISLETSRFSGPDSDSVTRGVTGTRLRFTRTDARTPLPDAASPPYYKVASTAEVSAPRGPAWLQPLTDTLGLRRTIATIDLADVARTQAPADANAAVEARKKRESLDITGVRDAYIAARKEYAALPSSFAPIDKTLPQAEQDRISNERDSIRARREALIADTNQLEQLSRDKIRQYRDTRADADPATRARIDALLTQALDAQRAMLLPLFEKTIPKENARKSLVAAYGDVDPLLVENTRNVDVSSSATKMLSDYGVDSSFLVRQLGALGGGDSVVLRAAKNPAGENIVTLRIDDVSGHGTDAGILNAYYTKFWEASSRQIAEQLDAPKRAYLETRLGKRLADATPAELDTALHAIIDSAQLIKQKTTFISKQIAKYTPIKFISGAQIEINLDRQEATIHNYGHPVRIMDRTGAISDASKGSPPLGAFAKISSNTIPLDNVKTILFTNDGIDEANLFAGTAFKTFAKRAQELGTKASATELTRIAEQSYDEANTLLRQQGTPREDDVSAAFLTFDFKQPPIRPPTPTIDAAQAAQNALNTINAKLDDLGRQRSSITGCAIGCTPLSRQDFVARHSQELAGIDTTTMSNDQLYDHVRTTLLTQRDAQQSILNKAGTLTAEQPAQEAAAANIAIAVQDAPKTLQLDSLTKDVPTSPRVDPHYLPALDVIQGTTHVMTSTPSSNIQLETALDADVNLLSPLERLQRVETLQQKSQPTRQIRTFEFTTPLDYFTNDGKRLHVIGASTSGLTSAKIDAIGAGGTDLRLDAFKTDFYRKNGVWPGILLAEYDGATYVMIPRNSDAKTVSIANEATDAGGLLRLTRESFERGTLEQRLLTAMDAMTPRPESRIVTIIEGTAREYTLQRIIADTLPAFQAQQLRQAGSPLEGTDPGLQNTIRLALGTIDLGTNTVTVLTPTGTLRAEPVDFDSLSIIYGLGPKGDVNDPTDSYTYQFTAPPEFLTSGNRFDIPAIRAWASEAIRRYGDLETSGQIEQILYESGVSHPELRLALIRSTMNAAFLDRLVTRFEEINTAADAITAKNKKILATFTEQILRRTDLHEQQRLDAISRQRAVLDEQAYFDIDSMQRNLLVDGTQGHPYFEAYTDAFETWRRQLTDGERRENAQQWLIRQQLLVDPASIDSLIETWDTTPLTELGAINHLATSAKSETIAQRLEPRTLTISDEAAAHLSDAQVSVETLLNLNQHDRARVDYDPADGLLITITPRDGMPQQHTISENDLSVTPSIDKPGTPRITRTLVVDENGKSSEAVMIRVGTESFWLHDGQSIRLDQQGITLTFNGDTLVRWTDVGGIKVQDELPIETLRPTTILGEHKATGDVTSMRPVRFLKEGDTAIGAEVDGSLRFDFTVARKQLGMPPEQAVNYAFRHEVNHGLITRSGARERIGSDEETLITLSSKKNVGIPLTPAEQTTLDTLLERAQLDPETLRILQMPVGEKGAGYNDLLLALERTGHRQLYTDVEATVFTPDAVRTLVASHAQFSTTGNPALNDVLIGRVQGENPTNTLLRPTSNLYSKIIPANANEVFSNTLPTTFGKNILGGKAVVFVDDAGNTHVAFLTETVSTHHRHALATLVGLDDPRAEALYAGITSKAADLLQRSAGFELQYDSITGKIIRIQQDSWITKRQLDNGILIPRNTLDNMELKFFENIDPSLLDDKFKDLRWLEDPLITRPELAAT